MIESVAKFERLMNLVAYLLASGEPVPFSTIRKSVVGYNDFAREDAVEKRFDRDKKELREIGIPVEYISSDERGRDGYFIPLDEYFHHDLDLSDDEAALLVVLANAARGSTDAISSNLRSALLKMAIDSPLEEELQQEVSQQRLSSFSRGKRDRAVLDHLDSLVSAVASKREVSFRYKKVGVNSASLRTVHPYGLGYRVGVWYVVGLDLDREDVRQFKVVRIQGAVKTRRGRGPDFKVPAGFDIEEYTERLPWEYETGKEEWAEILFDREVAFMVRERKRRDHNFSERPDGSGVLRLKVRRSDKTHQHLLNMLGAYSGQCAVLKPKWLRQQAIAQLEELRQRYD